MESKFFNLRNFGYFLLIFGLRTAGYFPTSKNICHFILLQALTVTHIITTCAMLILPFIYGSYVMKKSGEFGFWAYIAVGIHSITCLAIVICLMESLIQKRNHHKLLLKLRTFKYDSYYYGKKLNKLTVKFIIIFIFIITFSTLHMREYKSLSYFQFFAFRYCNFMLVMKYFQFNVTTDIIATQLEFIRDELKLGLEYRRKVRPVIVKLKFIELRIAYEEILEMSNTINKCFSWTFLSMGVSFISYLIALGYWGLISLLKNIYVFTHLRK